MTTTTDEQPTAPVIVAVIGDSLTLPRQFQGVEFHHTYPYLLAYWLRQQGYPAEVWEATEAGVPIAKLFGRYSEYRTYVGKHRPGIGIVHLGVVDCSPRPVPLGLRTAIGKLPGFLRSPIIRFLHSYRVQLLHYGPGFVFTRPKGFEQTYRRLLSQMTEDFGHVYAINIIPPGPYFESRSPGVGGKIEEYNRIIVEAVRATEGAELVDIWEACQQPGNLETYVSEHDGHHLSIEGHRRILEMIVDERTAQTVVDGKRVAQKVNGLRQ